jgi:hypothetical protein
LERSRHPRLPAVALRREQGRLDELEETVRRAVHTHPTYPVWRCVLADLCAELGRGDEARAEFERFAAGDFTVLPFNEEWLLGMILLADVCAALGDIPRSVRLYEIAPAVPRAARRRPTRDLVRRCYCPAIRLPSSLA